MSKDKKNRRGAGLPALSPMEQDCLQSVAAGHSEREEKEGQVSPVFPTRHETLASTRIHKRRGALLSYVIAVFVFVAMFSAFMTKRTMTDTFQVMLTRGTYKNQYYSRAIAEVFRGALLSNHKYTDNGAAVTHLQSDAPITADDAFIKYDSDYAVVPYLQSVRFFLDGSGGQASPITVSDIDYSDIDDLRTQDSNGYIYKAYFQYLDEKGMHDLAGSSSTGNSTTTEENNNKMYPNVTPGYYLAFMNTDKTLSGTIMKPWIFTSSNSNAQAEEAKAKYKLDPREFTLFTGKWEDSDFAGTDNSALCFYAVTIGLWADYPVANAARFLVNALTIRTNDTKALGDPAYLDKVETIVKRHAKDVAECISYPSMNDHRLLDILSQDSEFAKMKPYLSLSLSTAAVPIYETAMYQIYTSY